MIVGTGRHLTALELRAWTRFLDAARLLEEALAHQVKQDHGMTHAEYEVLVRLDGADGRMRMAQLADQVVSSRSRLTYTVDQLEIRGWVRREAVPEDGRGLEAVLLPEGSKALAEAAIGHAALIREYLLDPLDADEVAALADVMERVATGLRMHRR